MPNVRPVVKWKTNWQESLLAELQLFVDQILNIIIQKVKLNTNSRPGWLVLINFPNTEYSNGSLASLFMCFRT